VQRLRAVHEATAQRAGEAEDLDTAFRALALSPPPLQRALAHAFAHPRLFNLTVSTVAGPAVPRYLRGCRLREVHSAVPLAARHALSIGVVMVAGHACFGLYADAVTLPDAGELAGDLQDALDELVAAG
jgi:WS/DGAT C-terminal domain